MGGHGHMGGEMSGEMAGQMRGQMASQMCGQWELDGLLDGWRTKFKHKNETTDSAVPLHHCWPGTNYLPGTW